MRLSSIYIRALFCILLIPSGYLYSQTKFLRFYTPDDDDRNKTYIARDSIKFKVGYKYSAIYGHSMKASLDPGLQCNTAYMSSSSLPNLEERILDDSKQVGATNGAFNVSSTGGATYQIPIFTPPGTAGMQPQISIVYNSQSGNGLLGMGWNISGLSAISRVPKNHYFDNQAGGIALDTSDRFSLDGNRLLTTGTYGMVNSTYNTEVENFDSIVYLTNPNNNKPFFKVIKKDGKILEYGNTDDSYVNAVGTEIAIVYMLNKVTDVFGNYIRFIYNEVNGETSIKKIEYTGNENANLAPYNTIEFYYEKKGDSITHYISGKSVTESMILYSIMVKSSDIKMRNYSFKYSRDIKTQLVQIDEENSENKQFNSTLIRWDKINSRTTSNVITLPSDGHGGDLADRRWTSGDFDGDGITDLISFYNHPNDTLRKVVNLYKAIPSSNGIPTFSLYRTIENWRLYDGVWFQSFWMTLYGYGQMPLIKNLDADNIPDIVFPTYESGTYGPGISFRYLHANSDTLYENIGDQLLPGQSKIPAYVIGDINNDGIDDIIYIQNHKVNNAFVGKIRYGGSSVWLPYNLGDTNDAPQKLILEDFNSDGLKDLMTLNGIGYRIYKNNGGSLSSIASTSNVAIKSTNSFIRLGDFNGDGMIDLIFNAKNSSNWQLANSKGNFDFDYNSLPNMTLVEEEFTAYNNDEDDCIVTDFNNDGKSDVITIDGVYNKETNIWGQEWGEFVRYEIKWFSSNGKTLSLDTTLTSTNENYALNVFTVCGDFNGDGREDLLNKGGELRANIINDEQWRMYNSFNSSSGEGLITSISNGMNQKLDIKYRPLDYEKTPENKDYYTKGNASIFPIKDIQVPLNCVWKISSCDSIGATATTEYAYENAKIHIQGKGFLGFEKITSTNPSGKRILTYITDSIYFFPYLNKTEIQSSQGIILSKDTITKYQINNLFNKRFFGYPKEVFHSDFTLNSSITSDSINDKGEMILKIIKLKEGEVINSTTTTSFLAYNSKGLPAVVIKSFLRNGETPISDTTSFTYNSNGTLNTTISKGIITKYDYLDSTFGLLKSVNDSAENMMARVTKMFYDSYGRFIIKKVNPLDHTNEFIYNVYGNPVLTIDENKLSIEQTYDGWGNLLISKSPEGKTIKNTTEWVNGGDAPINSLYCNIKTVDGVFSGAIYYNKLGCAIREVSVGLGGSKFYTDTKYNRKGQIIEVSERYRSDFSTTLKTSYTYWDDGRIKKQTLPNDVYITYAYEGNKTTTTYSTGEVYYKITDATGLLVESKDPGGIIKYYYESDGKTKRIEAPGSIDSITYDSKRRQIQLSDSDAGITNYSYDGFHQLVSQTNAMNKTTNCTYDLIGRIKTKTVDGITYTYTYDGENAKGMLMGISGNNQTTETYKYDGLMRLTEETRGKSSDIFTYKYEYNSSGDLSKVIYPAGLALSYNYNTFHEPISIYNGSSLVWKRDSINSDGQIQQATYGNNKQISYYYDSEKRLTGMKVPNLIDFTYGFNDKQQMDYRDEKYDSVNIWKGFRENFKYDGANRLWTVEKTYPQIMQTLCMTYQSNISNRIENKSDIGPYTYASNNNHRLTNVNRLIGSPDSITYTGTGKVATITVKGATTKFLTIDYGVDDQRFKTIYTENNIIKYTRYFYGNYEKEVTSTGTRHINYIYAGGALVCIYEQKAGLNVKNFIYTDILGSIRCITDSIGNVKQGLSYDVWGNRRNPVNGENYSSMPLGLNFYRGYTGHEHLDELGLINMNGRIYDPSIALFISPDKYVQDPQNCQSYNRYSYCSNNPLNRIDPSGYIDIPPIYSPQIYIPQIEIPIWDYKTNSWNTTNQWNNYTNSSNYSSGYYNSSGMSSSGSISIGGTSGTYNYGYSSNSYAYSYAFSDGSTTTYGGGSGNSNTVYANGVLSNGASSVNFTQTTGYSYSWEYSVPNVNAITISTNELISNSARIGDIDWEGVTNATILLAGGVAEMAVGGVVEFFSAGVSTPLSVPLILDGAARTVANTQRLSMYINGNSAVADAYPSSLGSALGKIGDMINGVPFDQVGNGQAISGTVNDFSAFVVTGGSGFAFRDALLYTTPANVVNYGFTFFNYSYSMLDNIFYITPLKR